MQNVHYFSRALCNYRSTMKVKIKKTKYRSVTLRLDEKVMLRVDEVAKEYELSRQYIIEKILETAMNDKKFEIEVSKNDY